MSNDSSWLEMVCLFILLPLSIISLLVPFIISYHAYLVFLCVPILIFVVFKIFNFIAKRYEENPNVHRSNPNVKSREVK